MFPDILRRYACVLTEQHEKYLPENHEEIALHQNGTVIICNAQDLAILDPYFPDQDGTVALHPFDKSYFRALWIGRDIPMSQIWEPFGGHYACYYNCPPTLASASVSKGGSLLDNGYGFDHAETAGRVIRTLGGHVEIPELLLNRSATLERTEARPNRLPRVKLRIRRANTDGDIPGWPTDRLCNWYVANLNTHQEQNFFPALDHELRAVTQGGEHKGYLMWNGNSATWDVASSSNARLMLLGSGLRPTETAAEMGRIIKTRRKLVQRAFQPEYPNDHEWNFGAPQFKYPPADVETPHHPHWDMILDHVGQELPNALARHLWARKYGIKTGRQYLQLWIASMLREPYQHLPYLFLHGPENSGKSILHEAFGRLITGGICRADKALTTTSDFNGELHNAVLAVVEETNVSQAGGERARSRMKDWVTGEYLNTRMMGRDSFLSENSLHFIQCSNDPNACLVSDTRLTVLHVPEIALDDEIPKSELKRRLENEASHFMKTLMDLEIPPTDGRLRIPYITTPSQERIMQDNDPQFALRSRLRALLPEKGQTVSGTATDLLGSLGKDVLLKEYDDDKVAARELSRMLNRELRGFRVSEKGKVKTITCEIAIRDFV